ncbi:MAG TPA: MBOAT family protein [Kofleriaceae bacterium]|nr:MBOAT family protein [Kofleriaceae bacterium]
MFFAFFAVTAAFHHTNAPWRAKKLVLFIASCCFYGAWNPPFLLLLWSTTVLDYFMALAMERTTSKRRRKLFVLLSLVGNLGMLAFFKYAAFAMDNVTHVAHALGLDWKPPHWDIVLPVGISFYTFHTLSYTLDVYRGELKARRSLLDFALFVAFFPVLVAGPIMRAAHFLPQLDEEKRGDAAKWGNGLTLLVIGLFQKSVLADGILAPLADTGFAPDGTHSFADAWLGTFAFSGQIFFDFAGYSLCAIGVARCFGFEITDNFRGPYGAYGFSDFWRRWHISLSSWLRDYLYIPLGGNRKGRVRTDINLMLTMLIGGLWHGASWAFVVWGGMHGIYLVIERQIRGARPVEPSGALRVAVGVVATYLLVCLTWVFFRAPDFATAGQMIGAMFGFGTAVHGQISSLVRAALVAGVVTAMVVIHGVARNVHLEEILARLSPSTRGVMLGTMLFLIAIAAGGQRAFIYFQF